MAPMSLYALSRSAGAKLLAETPATMVAMPPPSQRVKPRTCTRSQNPRTAASSFPSPLRALNHFGYGLSPREPRFQIVPELDPLLALLPAPEYLFPVQLSVEVDEDRKSTRLNSSHGYISYAVFCLKKKKYR